MKQNPGVQVNINRDLVLALCDRMGIAILFLIAAAVMYWIVKH